MSEEQLRLLQRQLWNIANTLRGKMNADEFRDYILGFIFYKYLSEKFVAFANDALSADNIAYTDLDDNNQQHADYIQAVKDNAIEELGYSLKPSELFHTIANRCRDGFEGKGFILEDLGRILKNIEQSTLGTDSADDFSHLFEDLDLSSSKLGNTEKAKN